jgi:hypothetical protein
MSAPVRFKGRTRYRPFVGVTGHEIFSAEEERRHDAEMLCERLSDRFINTIRFMDADELVVLELLANGISLHRDFLPDLFNEGRDPQRVISAARRFAAKRTKKGGAR